MTNFITLNNGYQIPQLGFGTIQQFGKQIEDNVAFALNHGYQLIDTANRYGNEVEVGKGLKQSGLKREDYYLETKLGPTLYENDQAIDDTLKRLGVDYIDVMILHHPVNNYIYAYKMLEKAYKEGKIKAIGLSNFQVSQIQEIMDQCEIPPMIMQVECHPYYPAEHVYDFCKKNHIQLQSWYPLGLGNSVMLIVAIFVELAKKYDTFGYPRQFKTSTGETITVSGGDYGWLMARNDTTTKLIEAIKSGKSQTIEPEYTYKGYVRDTNDIGNTYVEVSLSAQHMWFYKNGQLLVDTDVVTGNHNLGHDTKTGIYAIMYKERNATLVGEDYSSPVKYWMPFYANVGIHDASWRTTFGGSEYLNNGSHGCVNTPEANAEKIFNNIEKGVPVVVY